MSKSRNIQYQYYKVQRGSEWWAKAQSECQRWRDWMANARKVAKKISAKAGVKNDSFSYVDEGWRGKGEIRITGLQCELTGTPQSHGLKQGNTEGVWAFRSNKLGKELSDLANSTRAIPFLEFLPESDELPYNTEFIFTSRGLMHYRPKVYHTLKGPKRTVVVLGCDYAENLEVPGLPEGVVQVTMKEADDFLNNRRSSVRKPRAKATA